MILDVKFFEPNIGFIFAGTSDDLSQSNALTLRPPMEAEPGDKSIAPTD
jgi:hypothetical protein